MAMTPRAIHYGWAGCYRIQVMRYAGYEVRDCQSIENLAAELQSHEPVDFVVISEDDWRDVRQLAEMVRSYTTAPMILF